MPLLPPVLPSLPFSVIPSYFCALVRPSVTLTLCPLPPWFVRLLPVFPSMYLFARHLVSSPFRTLPRPSVPQSLCRCLLIFSFFRLLAFRTLPRPSVPQSLCRCLLIFSFFRLLACSAFCSERISFQLS